MKEALENSSSPGLAADCARMKESREEVIRSADGLLRGVSA